MLCGYWECMASDVNYSANSDKDLVSGDNVDFLWFVIFVLEDICVVKCLGLTCEEFEQLFFQNKGHSNLGF